MTCANFQELEAGLGASNPLTISPIDFPYDNIEDLRLDIYNYQSEEWVNVPIATGKVIDVEGGGDIFYAWEVTTDNGTQAVKTILATDSTDPKLPSGETAGHPLVPEATSSYPLDNGTRVNVRLYRMTSIDAGELPAYFYPGASIRAQDLNDNFEALRKVLEESTCPTNNITDGTAQLDARYWNKADDTLEAGEAWVSDDAHIATTAAGDARWLNSDGNDITAGAGLSKDTSTPGTVKLGVDLWSSTIGIPSGLETALPNGTISTDDVAKLKVKPGAGLVLNNLGTSVNPGNGISVAGDAVSAVQGTGTEVNATGIHAGITTIDVVNGPNDPDIRLTETLNGTASNTDIGIIGGNNINVTASGDDITIATVAGLLTDAPNDGNLYGRRNQAWAVVGGGSGEGVEIVAHTRALNAAAGGLDATDAGAVYLVQDSTNIDGTVGTPGADNPAPAPAVAGLPAAPTGGWDDTVQTAVQWTGTAWTFIRYQASSPDQRYVKLTDGAPNTDANRQSIRWNGLDLLAAGPTDINGDPTEVVAYQMRISTDGNRRPEFQINAGTQEAAEFQLASGDQGGGVNTHGIYMNCGNTVTRAPRVTFTGNRNDGTIIMDYSNTTAASGSVGRWELLSNGDFETTGNIVLNSDSPRVGVTVFGLSLNATPTENYNINFPPGAPLSAGGQVLRTTTSNSGQDLAWVSVRDDSANDDRYLINSNAPAATGQGGGDTMIGQLTLGAGNAQHWLVDCCYCTRCPRQQCMVARRNQRHGLSLPTQLFNSRLITS